MHTITLADTANLLSQFTVKGHTAQRRIEASVLDELRFPAIFGLTDAEFDAAFFEPDELPASPPPAARERARKAAAKLERLAATHVRGRRLLRDAVATAFPDFAEPSAGFWNLVLKRPPPVRANSNAAIKSALELALSEPHTERIDAADELLEALTALRVAVEHLAVLTDEAGRPGVGTGRVIPNRIERVAAAVFQVWVANTSASARSLKAQGVSNAARENTIDPLNVHALQRMVHLITHAHAALSAPGGVASEVALWRERGWGWTAALATEAAAWWNLSAALVGIPPHAPSTRWTLLLSEARKTARVAQDAERAARSAAPSLKLSRVV